MAPAGMTDAADSADFVTVGSVGVAPSAGVMDSCPFVVVKVGKVIEGVLVSITSALIAESVFVGEVSSITAVVQMPHTSFTVDVNAKFVIHADPKPVQTSQSTVIIEVLQRTSMGLVNEPSQLAGFRLVDSVCVIDEQ